MKTISQRHIAPTKMIRGLALFERHLFNLLPLYSPSGCNEKNQVIQYSVGYLRKLGRKHIAIDEHFNVVSNSTGDKAVVAHTDAVGKLEPFPQLQSIKYSSSTGIIYNDTLARPMGGDDKVGVAIALAVAEIMPDMNIWLMADEEIGCKGSRVVDPGRQVELALQFDRKGSTDLINNISGTELASKETTDLLVRILPHRRPMGGMSTDVCRLCERDIVKTAFNFSCGYYEPHSIREYIIYDQAMQAMMDAVRVLSVVHVDDLLHPKRTTTTTTPKNDRFADLEVEGDTPKALAPPVRGQTVLTNPLKTTKEPPTATQASSLDKTSNGITLLVINSESEIYINFGCGTKKQLVIAEEGPECDLCKLIPDSNLYLAIGTSGMVVCDDCATCMGTYAEINDLCKNLV